MAYLASASKERHASAGRARGLVRILVDAATLWRHRRELTELPPERLRDLGLSEKDVRTELSRPIWNAPDNWLR